MPLTLATLLQEGDDAAAGEPAGASANGGARHKQDSDLASVSFRLQRVDSDDLIEFPETADGYVSKVCGVAGAMSVLAYLSRHLSNTCTEYAVAA